MNLIMAIDPGHTESAHVIYDAEGGMLHYHDKGPNGTLLEDLRQTAGVLYTEVVIERVACMGMAVGEEVFETVDWCGRFREAWGREEHFHRVKRHEVKMHLCGNMRAKDPNIRQALLDRWGGKDKAVGRKAAPGPLFGVAGDVWSALAVAVTWADRNGITIREV